MFPRILCLFSAGLLMAQSAADPATIGRKAVDLLLSEKYADLEGMFAQNLKDSLKLDALTKLGGQIHSWGAAQNIGAPSVRTAGSSSVVVIPVTFAAQNLNVQMGINSAGLITGFFALPGASPGSVPLTASPMRFRSAT